MTSLYIPGDRWRLPSKREVVVERVCRNSDGRIEELLCVYDDDTDVPETVTFTPEWFHDNARRV